LSQLQISTDYPYMFRNIIKHGTEYLETYKNISSLVIGISGGIDSALVAILASYIKKRLNREITIIGRSLPSSTNSYLERERAEDIGYFYCNSFEEVSIDRIFETVYKDFIKYRLKNKSDSIRLGNIKARLRMMYLYNLASKHKGLVLSTDNLTEYNLGFWTLHGDVGDLGFIQNLWKTEVYNLTKWYVDVVCESKESFYEQNILKECIKAKPTDGLGISESDLHQILPNYIFEQNIEWATLYQRVDNILIHYLHYPETYNTFPISESQNYKDVLNRHINTAFKRLNPVNIPRDKIINKP